MLLQREQLHCGECAKVDVSGSGGGVGVGGRVVSSMVVFPYRIRPFGEDSSLGICMLYTIGKITCMFIDKQEDGDSTSESTTNRGPGSPANPALMKAEPRSNTIGRVECEECDDMVREEQRRE